MPFMGMLAKPLFGAIADRYRCQKIVFLTFILVTAAAFLATFYSPTIEADRKIHFACDGSITALDTCINNITLSQCAAENLASQFEQNIRCDVCESLISIGDLLHSFLILAGLCYVRKTLLVDRLSILECFQLL